jgi:putative Mg2+ transporter-C (MgtC) family protein
VPPTQLDLVLRLLLAGALAGLLGGERELTEQPAGFRTHILVALGACLFAIISAYGFEAVVGGAPPGTPIRADVTRIASQIVVGIGFLGGGAILKYGASIRGLTTAASLWVTAAVGTAVGLGNLLLAAVTTLITLLALVGLRPLRRILRRHAAAREEFLVDADAQVDLHELVRRVTEAGGRIRELRIADAGSERSIRLSVECSPTVRPVDVAAELARLQHVRNVDWTH